MKTKKGFFDSISNWMPKSIEIGLNSIRRGYVKKDFVIRDFFAGSTVGIVALPLAMAFAIASGVTPEKGIFTAIIGGLIISILSGSRYQIGGPTGAFVIVILNVVNKHGYEGLLAATLLAGIFLIIFGLLKLGSFIKYIPYSVTLGFTAGIGFLIFTTQIKDFFGLTITKMPEHMWDRWISYFNNFSSISFYSTLIAIGTILLIFLIRRSYPKIPAQFTAVIIACLAIYFLHLPVETIGSKFGGIPSRLPEFHLPLISFSVFRAVLPEALTIAILAAIESLLCAVVADGMTGDKHRSNTELVAQGIANIGAAAFGGIPATGAIARTATSIKAGARSPLAGIIHVLVLIVFILFLAPLASYIPLACLAGILVMVSWDMSEVRTFIRMLKSPKSDVAVMLVTFLLTVLADITVAVQFGMVLAAFLFMKRMSDVTNMVKHLNILDDEKTKTIDDDPDSISKKKIPDDIDVYEINGPFFFGVADKFNDQFSRTSKAPSVLIIRMRNVPAIDATGIFALETFIIKAQKKGTSVLLSEVQKLVKKFLKNIEFHNIIGHDNIIDTFDEALIRAKKIKAKKAH
jgi:sulfate permease, SulP family